MAKLKAGIKRCPAHESACHYLGCARVQGACLIMKPAKGAPFKRMSKLEPSHSKSRPQPKRGKK